MSLKQKTTTYIPYFQNTLLLKIAKHHLSLLQVIIFCWWRVWNVLRITKTWQRHEVEHMLLEKNGAHRLAPWREVSLLLFLHHQAPCLARELRKTCLSNWMTVRAFWGPAFPSCPANCWRWPYLLFQSLLQATLKCLQLSPWSPAQPWKAKSLQGDNTQNCWVGTKDMSKRWKMEQKGTGQQLKWALQDQPKGQVWPSGSALFKQGPPLKVGNRCQKMMMPSGQGPGLPSASPRTAL